MVDGAELMGRAKTGDRLALAELFAAARPRLRAVVSAGLSERLRAHTEVEDIVQATFVRASESLAGFVWQGNDSFLGWLLGIARNLILEEARLVSRLAEVHDSRAADGAICDVPSAATVTRRKDRCVRVREALERLKSEHAEVLQLAVLDRLPLKEIAVRMRRSHGGARNLLSEAMKRLREELGDTDSLTIVVPSSRFLRARKRKAK